MSFFDDASLVMIPSGYKTSKVYSVKPTDGTGDLTFSRSNDTATRVGPDGLIEKVRTNLALYSEDLTNAAYVAQNATITANTSTAPDGTTTADTYNEGTLSTAHRFYQQFTITANAEYGFSFYAKKNTLDIIRLVVNDLSQNFSWFGAQFDLTNGTITATATGSAGGATYIGGSITNVGNGWYRCSVNGTVNTTTALCFVHSSTSTAITSTDDRGGISYAGTSRTYFGWGFQFETGVTTDYIATTTAAVSVGPVANVPRLDYLGSSCPRLLLEGQRTSLVTFSESFDNAAWTKSGVTITANNVTSPDGYVDADLATATGGGELLQGVTLSTSTAYTFSFYVKKGTATDAKYRVYNFDSGINVVAPTSYISQTNTSTWARVSVSFTSGATGTNYGIYLLDTANAGTMYFWGAQVEAGAYATSYIPTLGAAVTRGAETCRKTGISSLIGQTSGSIFVESYVGDGVATMPFWLRKQSGGLYGDFITVQTINKVPVLEVYTGGVNTVYITGSTALSVGFHKFAVAYANNDFVLYIDGVQIGSDTSGTPPTCDELYVDQYIDGGERNSDKKQALLFKTRLSNADLAALTA